MLADIESFFHRLRRRFSRTERAARSLGQPISEGSGEEPGLFLIEIEDLPYEELERTPDSGDFPFLRRLRDREKYTLHPFTGRRESVDEMMKELCGDDPKETPSHWRQTEAVFAARIALIQGRPTVHIKLSRNGNVDDALRLLTIEAHRSQRRDYHVWLCSTEGGRSGSSAGFLLVPAATSLPGEEEQSVSAEVFRSAAIAVLGRQSAKVPPPMLSIPERLGIMSYNVHSCIGMDGRVSPRRIARVIARQGVDIVALQEIDHGRKRSRAEDQAGDIAAELGFHMLFCPAVVRGEERYGHALLSRWPLETVKIAALPYLPAGIWPEPRAALWAKVHTPGVALNVLSTHLGLSSSERMKQMAAILGPDWLAPVLDSEPVILCGDFNLTPGSPAHRLAAARLHDVAHSFKRGVHTYSSIRLVAQLDHIFVSPHFGLESVFAAQNDLTRVASDHLPLVAHLRMPGK